MDKSVYNMKAEKIQKAVKNKDFETAAKICDTIDWSEITSVRMLGMVSDVYEHVGRYDTAIDVMLLAYEEAPVGRRFLYKLTELALKAGNIREAEDFYRQFLKEAPEDNGRYILRYKIAEAKGEPLDKRITILEAYKRKEFDEEWAFNLASLYHKANDREHCVALCDDIILWFGVGPYVDQAMAMKEEYEELTGSQLDHRINKVQYEDNLRKVAREMEDAGASRPYNPAPAELFPDEAAEPVEPAEPFEPANPFEPAYVQENEEPLPMEPLAEADIPARISLESEEQEAAPEEMMEQSGDTIRLPSLAAMKQNAAMPETANAAEMAEAVQAMVEARRREEAEKVRAAAAKQVADDFQQEKERRPLLPGNVLIIGAGTPQEGMTLAANALSDAHITRMEASVPVARISAKKLDERGLRNSLPLLRGKDLVVLGAGSVSDGLLMEIKMVADRLPGMLFVLLDSRKGIEALYRRIANEHPATAPSGDTVVVTKVISAVTEALKDTAAAAAAEYAAPGTEGEAAAAKAPLLSGDDEDMRAADATIVLPTIQYKETLSGNCSEDAGPVSDNSDTIVLPVIQTEEKLVLEEMMPQKEERAAFDPEEIHVVIEEPQVVPTALEPAEPVQEDIFTIHLADIRPTEDLAGTVQAVSGNLKKTGEEEIPSITMYETNLAEAMPEKPPVSRTAVKTQTMDEDAFVDCIMDYAKQIDCVMADDAEDGILDLLDDFAADGVELTKELAIRTVETAADNAEKKGLGSLFKSKYDKEGNLILRARNFI